jgi:hypothetical protein
MPAHFTQPMAAAAVNEKKQSIGYLLWEKINNARNQSAHPCDGICLLGDDLIAISFSILADAMDVNVGSLRKAAYGKYGLFNEEQQVELPCFLHGQGNWRVFRFRAARPIWTCPHPAPPSNQAGEPMNDDDEWAQGPTPWSDEYENQP